MLNNALINDTKKIDGLNITATFIGFVLVIFLEYLGFGSIPLLKSLHFTTILAFSVFIYTISKNGFLTIINNIQTKLLILFLAFTFLSLFHSFITSYSYDVLRAQLGYFILFFIAYYSMTNIKKINLFASLFLLCHLFLVLVNFHKFSGPRTGGFEAGYFLANGNDFAWGLIIIMPFSLYLFTISKTFTKKILSIACCALFIGGIIGTASRGATVALGASLIFLMMHSKKKVWGVFVVLIILISVVSFAPASYFERMETLQNYEEESSARMRMVAWKAATKMAIDNPILGVGAGNFSSVYGRFYRPENLPEVWASTRWISTHSIYFLILGEYGFSGLFILVLLLFFNYRSNNTTKKIILNHQEHLSMPHHLPFYINMSLIGYIVGGLFLGGIHYPHLYILTALTLAVKNMVDSELARKDIQYST